MKDLYFYDIYRSDFIDDRGIKWTIDMWGGRDLDTSFLHIDSYAISKTITIEFKDLTDLIILLNGFDYIPQDLRKFCIRVYKNKAFL